MTPDPSLPAPRVAIVGVRRLRQGLGEHFARWLVAAGAQVPAFIGRTPESVDEGRRLLAARGIDARGFTSLDALLDAEPVDALVIASPAETHREWLERALDARLHVLCEKPFIWGPGETVLGALRLAQRFLHGGIVLAEHCQWPWVLPAFRALHPESAGEPLRRLEMELSPSSCGEAMLADVMSHPLSVMQELVGDGDGARAGCGTADVTFSTRAADAERLDVSFRVEWIGAGAHPPVEFEVRLVRAEGQPRHAALVVNGRRAVRRVRMPGYEMTLADGPREVPLPDPMQLAVADFVRLLREVRDPARAAGGEAPGSRIARRIPERLWLLGEIVAWYRG